MNLIKISVTACLVSIFALVQAKDWAKRPVVPVEIGDVVVRTGTGFWSKYFIAVSTREKRFSHVGIVVSNGVDNVKIIHSEANDFSGIGEVRIDTWGAFIKDATECAVFRYEGNNVGPLIAKSAMKRIGVPFDVHFDIETTNALYCTELVRISVNEAVGHELVGTTNLHGRPIVAIDDIYRTDFVRVYDSRPLNLNK